MATLFTDRFSDFLVRLQPYGAATGHLEVPSGLSWTDARLTGNETCRDMLLRCVANAGGGNVASVEAEDDLAVIAFIRWGANNRLISASIQAIKTEGIAIKTYLARAAQDTIRYFRLDIERRRTGVILALRPRGGRSVLAEWLAVRKRRD